MGQVQKQDFIHLPITQRLSAEKPLAPFPAEKSVKALEMLKAEFDVRFRELHVQAKEIYLLQNPFAAEIDEALPSYQLELGELQNCDFLKECSRVSLNSKLPSLTRHTQTSKGNEDVHTF